MAMMLSDVHFLYDRCSQNGWLRSQTLLQKICMIWWPRFLVVRSNTKSEKDVSFLLKELCSLIDSAIPKDTEAEVQSEELF